MKVRLAAVVVGLMLGTSPLYGQEILFRVTVPFANLHAGPSTASPVIATVPRTRSFEVTRELGSWVAVAWPAAPNGVGYLHVSWGTISRGAEAEAPGNGSSLTGAAPAREPAPASVSSSAPLGRQLDSRPGPSTPPPAAGVLLPSHVVGLGGRMGTQALAGFAVMGRLWLAGPLGAELELGRTTSTSPALLRMNVVDVGINAIAALPDLASNAVWMRPYIGGGVRVFRSSLRSTAGPSLATDTTRGYQAFGGAEFTWANVPQLAVSADWRHTWATTPFSGFDMGGAGLAFAAHWYLR